MTVTNTSSVPAEDVQVIGSGNGVRFRKLSVGALDAQGSRTGLVWAKLRVASSTLELDATELGVSLAAYVGEAGAAARTAAAACDGVVGGRRGLDAHWPVRPSMHSRTRSACPQWRAYSSIMWTMMSRTSVGSPWTSTTVSRSVRSSTSRA